MSAATFTRDDLVSYSKQTPATDTTAAAAAAADDSAAAATKAADNVTDDATDSDIDPSPDSSPAKATDSTDSSEDGTSDGNADSSTADAESPDSDTHADDSGANQNRSRARDRIEDLIAERNALKAYGRHLESRLAEVGTLPKQPDAKAETTSTTATDADDEPPTLAAHSYDPDAYAKANAAWLKRQVGKEVAATLATERAQESAKKVEARFREQEIELRKTAKDYDTVIENPNLPKLSKQAAREIVFSEVGPQLTYHLAKNPDLAARISRMAPEQQLVAIGRLEAQLTTSAATASPNATKTQPKKTVTKAPPPPTIVSTGGKGQKSRADMDMDEWVAADRAEKIAKREQKRQIRSSNAR
jgi:hypothetical protein